MNNIACDHTPLLKCLCSGNLLVIDMLTCIYVQLSIVENKSSILQANGQPANIPHHILATWMESTLHTQGYLQ